MRRLKAFLLLALGSVSMVGVANNSVTSASKIAFCNGELDGGTTYEIDIYRQGENNQVFGVVRRNAKTIEALGFALKLNSVDHHPSHMEGFTEFRFESDLMFAAQTGSFYTLFLYADHNGDVGVKQFFHYFRKNQSPKMANLTCAGSLPTN